MWASMLGSVAVLLYVVPHAFSYTLHANVLIAVGVVELASNVPACQVHTQLVLATPS